MNFFLLFILLFGSVAYADDYQLGHGYNVDKTLNIGAYFSLDYSNGKQIDRARIDDVAILLYGNLPSDFSYLIEFEAAPFYTEDFKNNTSERNSEFHYERAYVNYAHSESLNFRLGKFISPIGYWNLEPINVLRDTTSNPLYSKKLFPKFITGADVSGYIDEDGLFKYHVFFQGSDDIDTGYINIRNDFFVGAALDYEPTYEIDLGASVGYYETYQNKNVSLFQINAKYESFPYLLQTEWAYTQIESSNIPRPEYQYGGYIQGMYQFNQKHALVGRYERFKDGQDGIDSENDILVLGYSYRPLYAISIKGEYQFNSDSALNQSAFSFSVLF